MKDLQWFRDRRSRMLPGELPSRLLTTATRKVWQVAPAVVRAATWSKRASHQEGGLADSDRFVPFAYELDATASSRIRSRLTNNEAAARLVAAADELLLGSVEILGTIRHDLKQPDWDRQPKPSLPEGLSHEVFPSAKHWWELSRGNILTQLAAAGVVTGQPQYLERASALLVDWCEHFASPEGPMWESGVELGIRMQSWSWLRRLALLEAPQKTGSGSSSGFASPFDAEAVRSSIINHLEILRLFPSSHSSANNHRLLEAAGLFCGGCCFADLVDDRLARDARETGLRIMVEELQLQVTSAGLHREQAIDYHCFVLEAAFFALLEGELHGIDIPDHAWNAVHRMTDALDAICDSNGSGPHFGDSDNSHVVQLDATHADPSIRALTLMAEVAGGPCRERHLPLDVRSAIVAAVVDAGIAPHRRRLQRPAIALTDRIRLAEDGLVIMHGGPRTLQEPEVWLALRSGPLGYLPIAAHAHADLNSIEVRIDGVPFVVDPGTFAYGEDPFLRQVFRQTPAHSTLTVGQQSQARYAGPFLWSSEALGTTMITPGRPAGGPTNIEGVEVVACTSTHDGFNRFFGGPLHRRGVSVGGSIEITDTLLNVESPDRPAPTNSLSPGYEAEVHFLIQGGWVLELSETQLTASHPTVNNWTISMQLDPALRWRLHGADPSGLGWQAPRYGSLCRATSLRGTGRVASDISVVNTISWSRRPGEGA